jgi:hypothetical protein
MACRYCSPCTLSNSMSGTGRLSRSPASECRPISVKARSIVAYMPPIDTPHVCGGIRSSATPAWRSTPDRSPCARDTSARRAAMRPCQLSAPRTLASCRSRSAHFSASLVWSAPMRMSTAADSRPAVSSVSRVTVSTRSALRTETLPAPPWSRALRSAKTRTRVLVVNAALASVTPFTSSSASEMRSASCGKTVVSISRQAPSSIAVRGSSVSASRSRSW